MTYDKHRQSDLFAAVLLVAGLLIAIVFAGGYYSLRAVRVQREMALAEAAAVRAVREAESLRTAAAAKRGTTRMRGEFEPAVETARQMTLSMDEDGRVFIDGQSLPYSQLRAVFEPFTRTPREHVSVVLQVDGRCRFSSVAKILALCEEAGIEAYRLESRDE